MKKTLATSFTILIVVTVIMLSVTVFNWTRFLTGDTDLILSCIISTISLIVTSLSAVMVKRTIIACSKKD